MNQRVIYYSDELNDDFAGTDISACSIDENYNYLPSSLLWKIAEFIVYRVIATPVAWLLCKIVCGLKIKNRKVLRKLGSTGFFLYGNHTHGMADAFTPTLISFPRRVHIVTSPDAVSIKGLGTITALLGAMPVPSNLRGLRAFRDAVEQRCRQNKVITIYPEAHIWPYYTGIRNFPASSFEYPVRTNAPCVAFAVTYRQRRFLKMLPPLMTITLSEPFYPDTALCEKQAKQKLRNEVFSFLADTVSSPENYRYISYIKTAK